MSEEIKFAFPITQDDGKEYSLEALFKVQEKEGFGQFLLSGNDFWHGGIHFSSILHNKSIPIRAIADGKVIAYRVNKKNKESEYKDDDVQLKLEYSNGFCLIKHEYGVERRVNPTAPPSLPQTETPNPPRYLKSQHLMKSMCY